MSVCRRADSLALLSVSQRKEREEDVVAEHSVAFVGAEVATGPIATVPAIAVEEDDEEAAMNA